VLVADREKRPRTDFRRNGKLLTVGPTELIGPALFYVDNDDIVWMLGFRMVAQSDTRCARPAHHPTSLAG
jgi:hypothetical protein